MKNLRSLKTIVEKDVHHDLRLKNRIAFLPYLIAILWLITMAIDRSRVIIIPNNLYVPIMVTSPILIIFLILFQKYLKKEILVKADLITVSFLRIEIKKLFEDYFGEDRISEQGKIIKNIFSDITDMSLCQLNHNGHIKIPTEIEFKSLKHVFKQNGKATILISFELNENGDVKMNYTRNEEPGNFKQHQFPYPTTH